MFPLRLLCGAEKFVSFTRGIKDGISPLSMLLSSLLPRIVIIVVEKDARLLQNGAKPVPALWQRNAQKIAYKYSKLVQFDMARGMEPESQFWLRPITLSLVRYPTSVGIVPTKRLALKFLGVLSEILWDDAPERPHTVLACSSCCRSMCQ